MFLVPVIFLPLNLYINYKKLNSEIIWVKPLHLMENFLYYSYLFLVAFLFTSVQNTDQHT